ncbi:hypothetical protein BH11PLA1_BH11PLA1_09490 [soil metagenome]
MPTLRAGSAPLATSSRPQRGVARAAASGPSVAWLEGTTRPERGKNILLDWFDAEALRSSGDALETLCKRSTALICELGELATFATGNDALAFAMLDEFARSRGLHIAELSLLLVEPIQTARKAVTVLMEEHDDAVVEIARLNRAIDIRQRAASGDLASRRDRGQVHR